MRRTRRLPQETGLARARVTTLTEHERHAMLTRWAAIEAQSRAYPNRPTARTERTNP